MGEKAYLTIIPDAKFDPLDRKDEQATQQTAPELTCWLRNPNDNTSGWLGRTTYLHWSLAARFPPANIDILNQEQSVAAEMILGGHNVAILGQVSHKYRMSQNELVFSYTHDRN